jgi:hypothetical protein
MDQSRSWELIIDKLITSEREVVAVTVLTGIRQLLGYIIDRAPAVMMR